MLKVLNNSSILDLGCNDGELGNYLKIKDCKITGVDKKKEIEKNTPEWYRANDLLNIMTRKKEEEKESEN